MAVSLYIRCVCAGIPSASHHRPRMRPAEYAAESTTTLKDNPRFGGLSSFALSRRMAKNDPRVVLITIVLSLGNLAICIHRSSRVYLFQQSRCLQHYLTFDPTVISPQWEVEESLCKIQEVQSSLSTTEGIDSVLQLLPALVALPTFQKLLPITGLRRLLLINLACVACGISLSIFFCKRCIPGFGDEAVLIVG